MRKTKLVIENVFEGRVIGLVSTLKDYKLAWSINQVFGIELALQPPIIMEFLKTPDLAITNFLFEDEFCAYRLLRNRGNDNNSGFLIPELVNFDFFLLIGGEEEIIPDQSVIDGLHNIKGISFFQQIDVNRLKSKDNFIF
jgi:hypothetical protein